jgi:hypothetical protein
MSRPSPAGPAHAAPCGRASIGRGSGRHRLGRTSGVRATDLPAVRARMEFARTGDRRRNAFVAWLLDSAPSGRHTWNALAQAGGRPRTAFAIILSL